MTVILTVVAIGLALSLIAAHFTAHLAQHVTAQWERARALHCSPERLRARRDARYARLFH